MNFETSFRLITKGFRILRTHPETPRDFKFIVQAIVMQIIFFFSVAITVYSLVAHDLDAKDLDVICINGIRTIFSVVILYSNVVMVRYKKELMLIINEMDEDYRIAETFSSSDKAVIKKYVKKGQFLEKLFFSVQLAAPVGFVAMTGFLMAYHNTLIHVWQLTYPEPIETYKFDTIPFIVLNTICVLGGNYMALVCFVFAPLASIFILHACGQLEIISNQINAIFDDNLKDDDDIEEKLIEITKKIYKVYRFGRLIQETFLFYHELVMKVVSFVLPTTAVAIKVLLDTGQVRLDFMAVAMCFLSYIALPCYCSDMLYQSCEKVRLSLYGCSWRRRYSRRSHRLLLMLLVRMNRPLAITAVFKIVNLQTLSHTLSNAYSIFNLINAAWTK